jgi:hypothetical protein
MNALINRPLWLIMVELHHACPWLTMVELQHDWLLLTITMVDRS